MVLAHRSATFGALHGVGAALLLLGCSAYDPNLIVPAETSAGGFPAPIGSGGTGGVSPSGCGDGRVAADELCDTAIAAGSAGACPTSCPALGAEGAAACATRKLEGAGCMAKCVMLASLCSGGDGCCPPACTPKSDSDCPSNCGNGKIETTQGETCEPAAAGPDVDAGVGCPTEADCDDGDPCTTDSLLGSAANCNAKCLNTPSTAIVKGDMCCPKGANSLADDDCPVMCGNKVVEKGEDCDGSAGCDSTCKINYTAAQMDCLTKYSIVGSPVEPCMRCACTQCTDLVVACRGDVDAVRKMKCDTLINCALANDCTGNPCYCGPPNAADPLCLAPVGKCKAETEAAAGSTVATDILARNTDTNYALGRASALGICTAMNCATCPQ
jgi:hypothetical protein